MVTWSSAREEDRDGPPEAKAEWGAGSGPHGAERSCTGRRSGEREKVSFHFQFFSYFIFKTKLKHDQSQIEMGFQIYFFNSSKNEEF